MPASPRFPDFLIIGAQRSGTTSLYKYLKRHPQLCASRPKEVHYFDHNYYKGPTWYSGHFRHAQNGALTFDSSPYYLRHPLVAQRVSEAMPKSKLIAILRNPIDRAVSQYQHEKKLNNLVMPIEEVVQREIRRFRSEDVRLKNGNIISSKIHQSYSLLHRGLYFEQLSNWWQLFPREQLLILKSEDFYQNPSSTIQDISSFLGIDFIPPNAEHKANQSSAKTTVSAEFLAMASEFFSNDLQKLQEDTGITWNL